MKKNVLIFITSYYPEIGGAEVAVREITSRIDDFNYFLICFSKNNKLPEFEKIDNINVFRVGGFKFLFPITAFFKALKLDKEFHFSAIWSIMATYAGFAGILFKIFKKRIFLLSLQEGDPLYVMKRKALIVYPLFVLMFKMADGIQTISNFLASYAKDMGYKKNPVVIPNGVSLSNFTKNISSVELLETKKRLNISDDDFVLITTSRLVYKNAIDDVIKSLSFLPANVKFIIVGNGKDEYCLRKIARDIGVRDRVLFLGFINQNDIPLFLKISNVFIRVSRSEGFGNSFIEAMAADLPVIASPVGGIPDFLSDGITGIFACPNNPKSIAEKVRVVMYDQKLVNSIRLNAKKMVVSDYSWDIIAKKMVTDFFSIINKYNG